MLLVISGSVVASAVSANAIDFGFGSSSSDSDIVNPEPTTVTPVCDSQYADNQTVCPRPRMDVVFLIDSTGSMSDEIREVKINIENIINTVKSGYPSPDVRVGIVTYRDYKLEEREYLTRQLDLTYNLDKVISFLKSIDANGGGDYSEAVADGLHLALQKMDWANEAKKIVVLIGDAPPHGEGSSENNYQQGSPNGYDYKTELEYAQEQNMVIYSVSGSGMDSNGVKIWKELAYKTGGDYEQLSYTRVDVDQYYAKEGVDDEFLAEAKTDSDYDKKSNSILVNTLKPFTQGAIMSQAADMGVRYDPEEPAVKKEPVVVGEEKMPEDDGKIDWRELTGRAVKEPVDVETTGFLANFWEKVLFWK